MPLVRWAVGCRDAAAPQGLALTGLARIRRISKKAKIPKMPKHVHPKIPECRQPADKYGEAANPHAQAAKDARKAEAHSEC